MLGMTPSAANRGISAGALCFLLRGALEDVEDEIDGAVADGVYGDVKSCSIGTRHPGGQVFRCAHEQPTIVGRIGERLEERSGVGAK
jgi:hypothetical protein